MSHTKGLYVFGDRNVMVPVHLNFGKFVLNRLQHMRGNVALIDATSGEELTIEQFLQYSVNLATSLTKLGIGKGDVIAIGSEKRITFMSTVLGIIFAGATCTPYDLDSGKAVLRHKLSVAKPTHFICSKLFWEKHEDTLNSCNTIKSYMTFEECLQNTVTIQSLIKNNVHIDDYEPAIVLGQMDTALILYSSGTTGLPKGVCLTHLNCIVSSLPDSYKDDWNIQTAYIFGEWYHNYDFFMTYKLLVAGKKVVYVDEVTVLNMFECIEKYQVNIAMILPFFINFMNKEESLGKFNLNSLKIIYSRSSLLHKNAIVKVKQRLPQLQNVLQGYGMTECGEPTSEFWSVKGSKPGSVGLASPGITIKVVDPNTNLKLGSNQHGEIRVTGPMFMKEYIHIEKPTYLDEEGFFKTGDIGYYDEDNYFYIVERIKDIVCYQGHKLAPLQLENLLEMHEKVLEAGVIGKPHPDDGERPMAFVVKKLGTDVTEQELLDHIASEVPLYMHLTGGVKFIDKLPRSPRGKILRRSLRELLVSIL